VTGVSRRLQAARRLPAHGVPAAGLAAGLPAADGCHGLAGPVFLSAAARAGRQIQTVVDALEAAGIESVLLKGPALRNGLPLHVGFVDRQRCDNDRRDEP
jgi:hypothetical protein